MLPPWFVVNLQKICVSLTKSRDEFCKRCTVNAPHNAKKRRKNAFVYRKDAQKKLDILPLFVYNNERISWGIFRSRPRILRRIPKCTKSSYPLLSCL